MNLELYLLFIGFYLTCFLVFLDFSCLQSTWEPVEIKYKKTAKLCEITARSLREWDFSVLL